MYCWQDWLAPSFVPTSFLKFMIKCAKQRGGQWHVLLTEKSRFATANISWQPAHLEGWEGWPSGWKDVWLSPGWVNPPPCPPLVSLTQLVPATTTHLSNISIGSAKKSLTSYFFEGYNFDVRAIGCINFLGIWKLYARCKMYITDTQRLDSSHLESRISSWFTNIWVICTDLQKVYISTTRCSGSSSLSF